MTLSASIVSAQLLDLREQLEEIKRSGADSIHIDIEDANFVPVMNLGTKIAEAVAQWGELPVEVHLMVADPELVLRLLTNVRLDSIAVHLESSGYPRRLLGMVAATGRKAGLAINPVSPVPNLLAFEPFLDFVLVLTTEPEDGEATFIERRLEAVREVATQLDGRAIPIIVDGGVNESNAPHLVRAGATGAVVGRALFGSDSMAKTVAAIRNAASA